MSSVFSSMQWSSCSGFLWTNWEVGHIFFLCQGSFGEIVKAYWRGTPVAVKRILPSLSDDRLVM